MAPTLVTIVVYALIAGHWVKLTVSSRAFHRDASTSDFPTCSTYRTSERWCCEPGLLIAADFLFCEVEDFKISRYDIKLQSRRRIRKCGKVNSLSSLSLTQFFRETEVPWSTICINFESVKSRSERERQSTSLSGEDEYLGETLDSAKFRVTLLPRLPRLSIRRHVSCDKG